MLLRLSNRDFFNLSIDKELKNRLIFELGTAYARIPL